MRRCWYAVAAYTVLAVLATWPLSAGIARDVAWDLGDPVLNMWILSWACEQMLAILGGDVSRIPGFFDANVFHPAPLTLAYSEHLFAQAVQVLPIYAATGNPILCYNLLFLSTFVLSGVGTFLFVRELTGNTGAAFVAGVLFAFAPYRIPQSSHLQVLSCQWMPLALYGFRRYFAAAQTAAPAAWPRTRPLFGAAAALAIQNLSCGYYLLYFSPFAAAYASWELFERGLWRRSRVWLQLAAAAALVAACTAPFLVPYLLVREQMQFTRARAEVVRYSADVYSYATAFVAQPFWGDVADVFPKPEGELFPGLAALVLATLGGAVALRRARDGGKLRPWQVLLLAASLLHLIAAIVTTLQRRVVIDLGMFDLQMSNIDQLLLRAAGALTIVLCTSPVARARARAFLSHGGIFLVLLGAAVWLSLGPTPQSLGRRIALTGLYGVLYDYVPGFDGVRAPARFWMIGALMLAILGGYGAARLTDAGRRAGTGAVLALALFFLLESLVLPFTVNGTGNVRGAEARLYRPERAPEVYKQVALQPADAVLAELPIGDSDYDVRAMFYTTAHWRRLVNGYSGFFPPHYGYLVAALSDVPRDPATALAALGAAGVTLVLVHERAYAGDQGRHTSDALRAAGARELFRSSDDVLLSLPLR